MCVWYAVINIISFLITEVLRSGIMKTFVKWVISSIDWTDLIENADDKVFRESTEQQIKHIRDQILCTNERLF